MLITKKNKRLNIKNKNKGKKVYKGKSYNSLKGGASFNSLAEKQEFNDRFKFFDLFDYKREENLLREMTILYSVINSIDIENSLIVNGSSYFKGRLNEGEIRAKTEEELITTYENKFSEQMGELNRNCSDTPRVEETEIIYSCMRGEIKENPEYFKVPENTYICFIAPLGYLLQSENSKTYALGLLRKMYNLNSKDFDNIVNYLGGLARHTRGIVNEHLRKPDDEGKFINERANFTNLDCFEHSTWYYPGQICLDSSLCVTQADIIDPEIEYPHSILHFTKDKNRIVQQQNTIQESLFQLITEKKVYRVDYKFSRLIKYRSLKKFRIFIANMCRTNIDFKLPDYIFMYEAFIHYINLKIFEKNSGIDLKKKKICLGNNACNYKSNINRNIMERNLCL